MGNYNHKEALASMKEKSAQSEAAISFENIEFVRHVQSVKVLDNKKGSERSNNVVDDTSPRRSFLMPKTLVASPNDETKTLYHIFKATLEKFGERPCIGARKKDMKGISLEYKYITYNELWSRIEYFGSGLLASFLNTNDKVAMISSHSVEWIVAAYACHAYSMIFVPMAADLKPDVLLNIFKEGNIRAVITNSLENTTQILNLVKGTDTVKVVIQLGQLDENSKNHASAIGISLFSFNDVEAVGRNDKKNSSAPLKDDIAIICPTTGTSGIIKLVPLPHRCFVSILGALEDHGISNFLNPNDVHFAHMEPYRMLDIIATMLCFYHGASIALTQDGENSLFRDLEEAKPTFLVGDPFFYEKVYRKLRNKPTTKRKIRGMIQKKERRLKLFLEEKLTSFSVVMVLYVQKLLNS